MTRFDSIGKHKQLLAFATLVCWLIACSYALWWFQLRHLDNYQQYWASFNSEVLTHSSLQPETGYALVVSFIDPECPCSRYGLEHIDKLRKQFGNTVEFIDYQSLAASDPRLRQLSRLLIPAGPAVGIWNDRGELSYFGPYSGGFFCGEGQDFVGDTLNTLQDDRQPLWINQEAIGCYCPWNYS